MILRNLGVFKGAWKLFKSCCFLYVAKTYLFHPALTYGPSMLPTIDNYPSVFLIETISTRYGKIACGDIVVLRHPQNPMHAMTKRVVGLEGDSITYVFNPESSELESDSFTHTSYPDDDDKFNTIVVPKGGVWVEGDNKYNSKDSRTFGPVPYGLVVGKMYWRITPLDKFGPFWNR